MRLAAVLVVLLFCCDAQAASFDCARAATVVEKAICADKAVSSLDERAVAAYSDAVTTLGLSDDERDPAANLLIKGHQDWTAARNRCGPATNCLLQQYLRRLAVLTYKPDSQAASPADPLVGRYGTAVDPTRELLIMTAPGGVTLVHIAVNAKEWNCSFTGIGRPDGAGGMRVVRTDFDGTSQGDHTILLVPTRLGLASKHADARDNVSAKFCGAGGSLEHPFPRRN